MIKKIFIFFLVCLLFATAACSSDANAPQRMLEKPTTQARMKKYLEDLTDQKMAGRRVGTKGEANAALYLVRQLQHLGIKPAGEADTYFQSFTVGQIDPVLIGDRMTLQRVAGKPVLQSENILGIIPGISDNMVIISAHYDHLGVIKDKLYPGANDNASGVAVVMELAASLCKDAPSYTILVAFWGGEEVGLLGSTYFCQKPTVPLEKIGCVINLDSVGNLGNDQKLLLWKSCENELSQVFEEKLRQEGWEIDWEENTSHNSDHWPFAKEGIAGFTLLSPNWLEDNHTPEDTINKVKTELLARLMNSIKNILI